MYLRCLTGDCPRQWVRWLPWAEFCYNSSYQASLKTSPFKVVYGRDPPALRAYEKGEDRLPAVEQLLERDEFIEEVRDRLEQAQQYSKHQYDKKHREISFTVGQWVWLRLLHRPFALLKVQGRGKMGPRYFGPYQVLEKIGDVAYRLSLPPGACLHDRIPCWVAQTISWYAAGCSAPTTAGSEWARLLAAGTCPSRSTGARTVRSSGSVVGSRPSFVLLGLPRGFSQNLSRLPARGQAVALGGERCYDRQNIPAAQKERIKAGVREKWRLARRT